MEILVWLVRRAFLAAVSLFAVGALRGRRQDEPELEWLSEPFEWPERENAEQRALRRYINRAARDGGAALREYLGDLSSLGATKEAQAVAVYLYRQGELRPNPYWVRRVEEKGPKVETDEGLVDE